MGVSSVAEHVARQALRAKAASRSLSKSTAHWAEKNTAALTRAVARLEADDADLLVEEES